MAHPTGSRPIYQKIVLGKEKSIKVIIHSTFISTRELHLEFMSVQTSTCSDYPVFSVFWEMTNICL